MFFGLLFLIIIVLILYFGSERRSKANIDPITNLSNQMDRAATAAQLEALAELPAYASERASYLAIAAGIRSGRTPLPINATASIESSVAATMITSPQTVAPAPAPPIPQRSFSDSLQLLENINVLLYLGAFLVVVSAGIFVGINYEDLAGGFKVTLLSAMTAVFYGSGLLLWKYSQKLKPAGTTFIGVGLIVAPLIGVAVKTVWLPLLNGDLVWLVTSLLCLCLYALTFQLTRQAYVNYFLMLSGLSLVLAGVVNLALPLHWLGWAATLLSMVYLWAGRRTGQTVGQPYTLGAQLFVPATLLLGLLVATGGDSSFSDYGITVLLAGVFYILAAYLESEPNRQYFAVAAASLVPLGLWIITLGESLTPSWQALTLMIMAALYVGILVFRSLPVWLGVILSRAAIAVMVLAGLVTIGTEAPLLAVCAAAAGLNLLAYQLGRDQTTAAAGLGFVLLLPLVLAWQVLTLDTTDAAYLSSALYTGIAAGLLLIRKFKAGHLVPIYQVAYGASLLAAWVFSLGGTEVFALLMAAVLALLIAFSAIIDRQPALWGIASILVYSGIVHILRLTEFDAGLAAVLFALTGLAIYGSSFLLPDKGDSEVIRFSGLAGPYVGGLIGGSWWSIGSLALAGGVSAYEGWRRHLPVAIQIAGSILMVSLQQALYELGVRELQVYMLLWAAYFAVLAVYYHYRQHQPDSRDLLTSTALFFATVPLLFQSLGNSNSLYGLWLIIFSIGLVVLGLGLNYRLVWLWAAVLLVVEVLYQLRDVLFGLPEYMVSLTIGAILIALAIYLLNRRTET